MSHKVHPYSHRLGIIRDWRSHWFGDNKKYRDFLKGDILIRRFFEKKLAEMYISGIEIERGEKKLRIVVKTSRPGMIIGRSGEGAEKLKKNLNTFMRKNNILDTNVDVKLDIEEVRSPEADAHIVGLMIKEMLEKRMPFRRVLKQTVDKVMANRDVQGVRVRISGRLNGAEMARTENLRKGRVPLQTFRADVDFSRTRAKISQGDLGVKVWIYKGDIFES